MKTLILFTLCIFSIICNAQTGKFYLDGKTVPENDGKVVLLITNHPEYEDELIIQTSIVKDGKFAFEGEAHTDDFAILAFNNYTSFHNQDPETELILENGNIKVFFDKDFTVGGTPLNNLFHEMNQIKVTRGEDNEDMVAFIKRNSDNLIGCKAIYSNYQAFSKKDIQEIVSSAKNTFLENEMVQMALGGWSAIQNINLTETIRNEIIGTKIKDFELITDSENSVRLYDFLDKSEYLIFDFWASWCKPCIKSMPKFMELMEKYKEKDIQMVSISLDENKLNWEWAIKQVNVPWPHISDLQGAQSELARAFGVADVPYTVITNKEGRILHCIRFPDTYLEDILEKLP